ncbi:MAG: FAD-dependent monooxygenase [Lachnospiraceae bacterium]|nr:FAD-dependent monooxygenase [Lachnospiraceae bacterium]
MILDNIVLPVGYSREELEKTVRKHLRKNQKNFKSLRILRRSLDARKKPDLKMVLKVAVDEPEETFAAPEVKKEASCVIAGSGPCGYFAALVLSEAGVKVTVLERGRDMDRRILDTENFFETGKLDPSSNVQFGEGGAGTFSDGKLNTLIKDRNHFGAFVLKTFYEHGADESILYDAKPHIGTDVLRDVIKNIRRTLVSRGVEIHFGSKLTDIRTAGGALKGVEVNNSRFLEADHLILAIGHSARDTFQMLFDRGLSMEQKPFAVGIRMEHDQDMITLAQYGTLDYEELGAASYKVTHKASNGRGVYSFCMCPGGYVVNASSEEGHLAVNGMSDKARDSGNANAGIVVQVTPEDFPGSHPLDGIQYQRGLEKKAWEAGSGRIPVQLYRDFKTGSVSEAFGSILPKTKGKTAFSDLNDILPKAVTEALKEAIPAFGKKIKGFDTGDAVLSAVESRTSSPVRILRDENREACIKGIYPAGEGAGYAGGIMSAAIDGMETALAVIRSINGELE